MIKRQNYRASSPYKKIEDSYFRNVRAWTGILLVAMACGIVNVCFAASQQQTEYLSSNQAEFRAKQACITVNIQANIYTYRVTNTGDAAIVGFEAPQHSAYNFQAPDGWEMDFSEKLFKAWTKAAAGGIGPGGSREFSMRVSSRGAVLGRGVVKLKLQSGDDIILPDVWVPVAEPKSYIALVALVILLIALLHSAIIILKDRRGGGTQVKGV